MNPFKVVPALFTQDEIKKARRVARNAKPGTTARVLETGVVASVMDRINEQTGQENHPRYLAYLLQYYIEHAPCNHS